MSDSGSAGIAGTQSTQSPHVYTPEQVSLIHHKVNDLFMHGEPGLAISLRNRLKAGGEIKPGEYMDGVHPEVEVAEENLEKITPPRHTGPGSGKDKWVEWALLVMDVDRETLEAFSRDDIIVLAQERGVLPKNMKG